MNSKEFRRRNLLKLLDEYPSKKAFAEKTGLAPGHVSQMANGYREMGDSVARRIEQELSLHGGWMDLPHETLEQPAAPRPPPDEPDMTTFIRALGKASNHQLEQIKVILGLNSAQEPEEEKLRQRSRHIPPMRDVPDLTELEGEPPLQEKNLKAGK